MLMGQTSAWIEPRSTGFAQLRRTAARAAAEQSRRRVAPPPARPEALGRSIWDRRPGL